MAQTTAPAVAIDGQIVGYLPPTGNGGVISNDIAKITVVTALPSDAAQHTDTLYLIKET
jgi:hypothetical protein